MKGVRALSVRSIQTTWRLGMMAGLLATWEVIAILEHDPAVFPRLDSLVTVSLPSFATFGGSDPSYLGAAQVLLREAVRSILDIVLGVATGAALGISSGLAAFWSEANGVATRVALRAIRSVPLMALIPLFAFWFGSLEVGAITYIAFGTWAVMVTITYESARRVSLVYVEQARLLGASPLRQFVATYPRAILPDVLLGARDGLGLVWAFSLGAEYVSAEIGLGHLVYRSYLYSDMGKLVVLGMIYLLLGYGTFLFSNLLLRRMGRWYLTDIGKEVL